MGCFDTSSSKSVSNSKSYTREQGDVLAKALNAYQPSIGQGEDIYSGQRLAPLTGTQQQAISSAPDYLNMFNARNEIPLYNQTGSSLSNILSGQAGASPLTSEDVNKYFTESIYNPTMKQYQQDVVPSINEAYAGPGYFGSARSKAQTQASQDLADWLGTQRSDLNWQVLQNNQALQEAKAGRALSAIQPALAYGMTPTQEAQQRLAGTQGTYNLAGAEQSQQQAQINTAIQKFAEENRITSAEDMSILMALLGLNYSTANAHGSSIGEGFGYGMFANPQTGSAIAGGIASIFSGGGAASDIRIKENIKPLSILNKLRSIKPYTYNFIGNDDRRIGLIAQEVETVFPEAVKEINGIKHIDIYAILSIIVGALSEIGEQNGNI